MKTLEIKVTTIANGYALDVNKETFMYFSLPKLMLGIAQHCQNKIDAENCDYFAKVLAQGDAPTEYFKTEVKSLKAEIKDAEKRVRNTEKERNEWKTLYGSKNAECKEAQKQVRALSRELKEANEKIKALSKQVQPEQPEPEKEVAENGEQES